MYGQITMMSQESAQQWKNYVLQLRQKQITHNVVRLLTNTIWQKWIKITHTHTVHFLPTSVAFNIYVHSSLVYTVLCTSSGNLTFLQWFGVCATAWVCLSMHSIWCFCLYAFDQLSRAPIHNEDSFCRLLYTSFVSLFFFFSIAWNTCEWNRTTD